MVQKVINHHAPLVKLSRKQLRLYNNHHAPLVKLSRKQLRLYNKPWITRGILVSIKNKQRLYQSHFLNGTLDTIGYFKQHAHKLKQVKQMSKAIHYKNNFDELKHNP